MMCMHVYRNAKINLTRIAVWIEINLLTQMFRENECENSSRAWIEESWNELCWEWVKLFYRAGDGPSLCILGLAEVLIISGPILQLPELTADVNGLKCEKNVNEM